MSETQSTVEYREIKGHPGYRVGSDGSVWSKKRKGVWRKLKPISNKGYLRVRLYPHKKLFCVHHLVLETFVGPKPKGMCCRHFPDNNPKNCRATNLQWGTQKQNILDKELHGTKLFGESHPRATITAEVVLLIRKRAKMGSSKSSLAKEYGIRLGTLCNIVKNRTWKHLP